MPKLPTPSWLTLPEALDWLADRGISKDDAKVYLPRAISDDVIRSRGRSKKYTGHNTQTLLNGVAWHGAHIDWESGWFSRVNDRGYAIDFDLVDISTDDLRRWVGVGNDQGKPEREPIRVSPADSVPPLRNRPTKYDWDAFFAEIVIRADLDGLPDVQADLERDMADWCLEHWGEQPSESTIRTKVSGIYRHPRRPQGQ